MLKEELMQLHEQCSNVGEIVKVMDKKKALVKVFILIFSMKIPTFFFLKKVHPEGKYVVDLDKSIDVPKLTTGCRVALRADSYALHMILPNKVGFYKPLKITKRIFY
jgi:26S proteasome regulatory subunit T6